MTVSALLNAYIDAQIVLALSAAIWAVARWGLAIIYGRTLFSLNLQMLYCVLTTAVCAPLVLLALWGAQYWGLFTGGNVTTISDFALAQYLDGRFAMQPSSFERLLMIRHNFISDVATLGSGLGVAVACFLVGGTLFVLGRLVRNGWQVLRIVTTSYGWRRVGRVEIRLTDRTAIPFSTRGLVRNYIVMPSALLLQSNDLRIAIAHEVQHIRQRDLIWELLLELSRPLFFWNPAFGYLKRQMELLRELACDERVLARGTFGVREYCDCLLRVCRDSIAQAKGRRVLMPMVPFAHVDSGRAAALLKYRVVSMFERTQLRPGRVASAVIAVPMIAVMLFGIGISLQSGDWSQDRLMLSTIVNLERMDLRTSMAGSIMLPVP